MQRTLRVTIALLLSLIVLGALVLLLSPAARRLAPSWLYYDLLVRQIAPLPLAAEQYVLATGNDFCSIGRDSACGGYRLVNARSLQVGANDQAVGVQAAWCVDYVVLRRNSSALSGSLIEWANIPRAMVVLQTASGFDSFGVEECSGTMLER